MEHSIPNPESGWAADGDLSGDALYGTPSDRRRRTVLCHLKEDDGETDIGLAELARAVAVREAGSEEEPVSPAEIRRVHVSLYHVHVPKLATANAVAFDRSDRTVALTETGHRIVAELEGLAGRIE